MHVTYIVSKHQSMSQHSLVDRGSNGGVAGNDVCVVVKMSRKVYIQGIDNHQLNNAKIGTVYVFALDVENGLASIKMLPYTDKEWDTHPHVLMTSKLDWNPAALDHAFTDEEQWFDAVTDLESDPLSNLFDEFGQYRHRVTVQCAE
jgi:hypothetical protein